MRRRRVLARHLAERTQEAEKAILGSAHPTLFLDDVKQFIATTARRVLRNWELSRTDHVLSAFEFYQPEKT